MSLTGIFHNNQVVFFGQFENRIHLARNPIQVRRQHGPRLGRQLFLHFYRIDIQGHRVDICEHRGRTGMDDGIDGGAERHRRGDHLVALPQSCSDNAEVQGGRARIDGDRMRRILVLSDVLLELRHLRTRAEPAGAHRSHDFLNFCILDCRGTENQKAFLRSDGGRTHQFL